MKLEYDQLLINENAYFYKSRRPFVKRDVEQIFSEAVSDKNGTVIFEPKIRESYVHGSKEIAKVSILVFEFKKRPSFLNDSVKNVFETKYGLYVIVESTDFVATIRKNISGIHFLYTLVDKIDHKIITKFLATAKSKYEKIVADNMNPAGNAIQNKTSEAVDLQNILSRFSASKQIIKRIRIDNEGERSAITSSTSRVNSFNIHKEFQPAIVWIVETMSLIRRAYKKLPSSNFIDSFATPVEYDDVIDDLTPKYLLLRLDALKNDIEQGKIVKCFNRLSRKKVDVENSVFNIERLYELEENDKGLYVNGIIEVRVRKKDIHISINGFQDYILEFDNETDISLSDYINQRHHFMVIFDKLEYVYSHRTIFRDSKLLGDIGSFLSTFISYEELKNIESEKGEKYSSASVNFKSNSLFHFTENILCRDAEFVVCDDMATEWGDFISISKTEICFYHCKHNKHGFSASNLQDVFGQVQKNFGVLQLTEELIEKRKSKWDGLYRIDGTTTGIKRVRKPSKNNSFSELKKFAIDASSNVNIRKKVYVVVNFISKTEAEKMVRKLAENKSFRNQGVALQMLWFVHGVLALAQDLGAEFKIICRP
jgi:hypothetical protein